LHIALSCLPLRLQDKIRCNHGSLPAHENLLTLWRCPTDFTVLVVVFIV
jgi:hypothetical protein